jgi:hypothetical protein
VASPRSLTIARKWIDECVHRHSQCPGKVPASVPARLIEVSLDGGSPRLHITIPGEKLPYVALSYCWGALQPAQLTTSRLGPYRDSIDLASLPRTVRDAITTTKALGFQYLWVDSLCILQDNAADMAAEISRMRFVYEDASLTISASSAANCEKGFLAVRKPFVRPISSFMRKSQDVYLSFSLACLCSDNTVGSIQLQDDFRAVEFAEPVSKRAWTMQEAMLSPRMLIYSGFQIVWRCRTSFETAGGHLTWSMFRKYAPVLDLHEQYPISQAAPVQDHPQETRLVCFGDTSYTLPTNRLAEPGRVSGAHLLNHAHKAWMSTVFAYTQRSLSVASDKLPAIAGVAEKFHAATGEGYLAGLWEGNSSLLVGFSWRRWIYAKSSRPPTSRAPSWSWASVEGHVAYPTDGEYWDSMTQVAEVCRIVVQPAAGHSSFGEVARAAVDIEGWLRPVEVEPLVAVGKGTNYSKLHWADVYLSSRQTNDVARRHSPGTHSAGLGPEVGYRCASATLDVSVSLTQAEPTPRDLGGELFALTLFTSRRWGGFRCHGVLLAWRPLDKLFRREGWFDSLPCRPGEFDMEWLEDGTRRRVLIA